MCFSPYVVVFVYVLRLPALNNRCACPRRGPRQFHNRTGGGMPPVLIAKDKARRLMNRHMVHQAPRFVDLAAAS
jgi:hypothetical protein